MNGNNAIKFSDGTELDKVESTEYLGGIMHVGINNKVEISSRIAATMPIMFALNHFWKQTKCSTRWKIEIFNSVIVETSVWTWNAPVPQKYFHTHQYFPNERPT